MTNSKIKVFALIGLIIAASTSKADEKTSALNAPYSAMMNELLDGPPVLASTALHPSAYVPETVQKLASGKIAYVNWAAVSDILHELGYENFPKKLTAELAQSILDKAGYAKPMPGEPASTYVDDFRDLFAIRYGGGFINYNFGSGRNAAARRVDIKGIGKTQLVRPWADGGHSNGTMSLADAIKEAVWSNILNEELPFGANRVLFVLTTGTRVNPQDPNSEPRALLVREDPMRPAYFQPNEGVHSTMMNDALRSLHEAQDSARMKELLPKLTAVLPMPAGFPSTATEPEKIRAGLLEMVDRISWQYATGYTRQVLMAGVSTSNTQMDKALDFGSTTSVIGFPQARITTSESPHGTADSLKSDFVLEFAEDLRRVLPAELARAVPTNEELSARVDSQFHKRILQGFLELAGSPRALSEELLSSKEGLALAETVLQIARAGNDRIEDWRNGSIVARTGTYNLEKILNSVASLKMDVESAAEVNRQLEKDLREPLLRSRLVAQYDAFFRSLTALAAREGISDSSIKEYVFRAVKARNKSMHEVRDRWALWVRYFKASKRLFLGRDDYAVQNLVDRFTERNVHEFKAAPFQIETSDGLSVRANKVVRTTFDAKTGVTSTSQRQLPRMNPRLRAPLTCHDFFS